MRLRLKHLRLSEVLMTKRLRRVTVCGKSFWVILDYTTYAMTRHPRLLYITVQINGKPIYQVLLDNEASNWRCAQHLTPLIAPTLHN